MPELKTLHKKYERSKEVLLVGVALDKNKSAVVNYCERNRIGWLQLFEPGEGFNSSAAVAFGVLRIPQIWIIDQQGVVAAVFLDMSQVDDMIKKLL